ncbi:hypothetical protein [Ekhidna sp.]|uniref:hypothetical protein n=1 Tax=Ekhidna sp. TaxID=2608089 RepID=UPI0032EDD787
MKLFTIACLLATVIITSCGKDDEPTAALPSVSVSATVDGEALANGGDVSVGSSVVLNITVNAPGGVNGLDVNGDSYNRSELGAEAGDTSGSLTLNISAPTEGDIGATASFEIEAVDDLGQTSTVVTFTYTIIAAPSPDVNHFEQVLIGGFLNSTLGSFYDAVEDVVYNSDDAQMNDEKIDLLFYYAETPMYTIAALDNPEADVTIGQQTGGDLDNFDPQNPTRFKTFLTAPDFDAIQTVADLESAYAGDAATSGESRVTQLAAGAVFGFELAESRGSKKGLIKVTETSGTSGSDRAITIEVKIVPE